MHHLNYLVFVLILLSNIHLGVLSDTTHVIPLVENEEVDDNRDIDSLLSSTTITIELAVEDVVDMVTESISNTTTTDSTTTTINKEQLKPFLTEYSLNVSLSSSSDITFNTYLNDSILLISKDHEIILVNKHDGTIKEYYKHASIIPINQSNVLIIFDDNTQELTIFNVNHQQKSIIHFKPKRIVSLVNNLWIAETSDELGLYTSRNFGIDWVQIENSSSSTILGWSDKANSVVIVQHSRYIKLLDVTTYKMLSILTDVVSTKLFSRYLFAKRSNINNSFSISHINNLADGNFRSLPKRFQSAGTFYCAIEDIKTEDLLLLFITDNKLGENNETISSTCNLLSYSKQYSFNLTNIDCGLIHNDNLLNTIECSTTQLPFYQVRGLAKSVFLANVASEATTMVSFDDGIHWNKTTYECDKTINCPNNVSVVISSLDSSNDAPGILLGKASDGVNEYVTTSFNGGRSWRLSSKGNGYLTDISHPNALIVTVSNNNNQQSLNHSYRYSTDYGRHWHEYIFLNETSLRILSLTTDNNNIFYMLTVNDENILKLFKLDFNLLNIKSCARHQVKEWPLPGGCINGSKLFYKRRISASHCLNNASEIRTESCTCSLTDFQCLPGYKRSIDGICLPKSHYTVSQDCSCNANTTLLTKRRGYVKSIDNQCRNGIENYLSDTFITHRETNHPNFFLYAIDLHTKRSTIEIHTNDFDQNDNDDDEEDSKGNIIWIVDQSYEITAVVFDQNAKQLYIAVEHDQSAIIYRMNKNLREQNPSAKQLIFDSNNELYKNANEYIEYLTMDWLSKNLYILVRNKITFEQTIFILDIRTRKRRTIVKNQHIQPSILAIDPIKTDLYWISHHSPSTFNIGNLQGEIKKQIQLFSSSDTNVSYMSYNPITHELIFIVNSIIYGLNTLDHNRLFPRIIYEHSSNISNALFVHPIVYFTNENSNHTDSSMIDLHAIDIVAKSYAKNIAKFKNFNSLKLFTDMIPLMPETTTINRCANNPCLDICIQLEEQRFRCICNDDARYQSCSCPTDEQFVTGSCQAKNNQCAPGRILCQNRINCAESARLCEQDHTQYTESFKNLARCTLEQANDGFDCYYNDFDNHTCIPFEWLCDGFYDCPFGNDEEHCHKMTTTRKTIIKEPIRCLTEKKFTHTMCRNKCMKIDDICRDASNALLCHDQFHLHCKKTNDKNQYVCKCNDKKNRCIAMAEQCDDHDRCEQVCKDSIHYANAKTNQILKPSSMIWIILVIAILVILCIAILLMTLRYRSRRKQTPKSSRTPAEAVTATAESQPSDTREKLLNNGSNTVQESS